MSDSAVYVRGRLSPRGLERLRRLFAWLYGRFADVAASGQEHFPEGGCLVTTNHLSRFDPPLIFFTMPPKRRLAVLVAHSYRRNPLFRSVVTSVDAIWVNRGATGPSTIKAAVRVLKDGLALGIAPEGTRSRTHALQAGKTGAAYLALAAGVPVLPAALTQTENLGRAIKTLRRIRLTMRYGQPYYLAEPGQRVRPDPERLEQCTTEIMCRIAALLPPEYRGVYADHPRVKELLAAEAAGRAV
jgi:1-acyl-sn-glycerol-3-phosphate acyltransferase